MKQDCQYFRFSLASIGWVVVVAGCSARSSTTPGTVETKRAAVYSSDPGTVTPGALLQRTASCPGNTFPDQCGGWAGVELKASVGSDAQRCHCRPIAFQVPASIRVTKGNAGAGTTFLSFRKGGTQIQKCTYLGNQRIPKSGPPAGGAAYELVACTDKSKAGSAVTADWFSLQVLGGDPSKGTTEVSLRLGAPDVVNGVVQEEILYSNDPRIPGAALHIPRGSAPPNQEFSFTVLSQPAVGSTIANGGAPAVTLGYGVDVHATGVDQFAFASVPGATCPRIDLPYSPDALVAWGGMGAEGRLRARQITDLAGLTSGASVLAQTSPVTIDPVNHLVSFCVSHLSYYVTTGKVLDAELTSAYLTPAPVRACATAADCNADEVCSGNCYVDLLATAPPPLVPNSPYVLHLVFKNNTTDTTGAGTWLQSSVRLWSVTPVPSTQLIPSPWFSNVPLSLGADVARSESASFDVTITSPMKRDLVSTDYPYGSVLDLCLMNGALPFGECFSWDPAHSTTSNGTTRAALSEICDGIDSDGNGEIDDLNGVTRPGTSCDNGLFGDCLRTGTYVCDGLFATKCDAPVPAGSADVCDGVDNDCDGVADNGCPAGLACGNSGGVPACQCPPHTGNDFYVDPVDGSDDAAGVFPTGVLDPPQCRFATLGKALSLATTANNRVLATTAASHLPALFTAETFPLSVASGVTLGTTDVTPTPANYTIVASPPLGATSIVALADWATLRGFSVATSANAATRAVSLGGNATIDTVRLYGEATPIGVDMRGLAPSVITGSLIDSFSTGVNVTSGGPLSIAGSTIQNSWANGIFHTAGLLTIGTTTVRHSVAHGVVSNNATLTLDAGARFDENFGNGVRSVDGAIVVNGSASAPISASANRRDGIYVSYGSLTANYLTLDGNGTGTQKASGLFIDGVASVDVGAAPDAVIVASNNGLHGVRIDSAAIGSTIEIAHANITYNGDDGIFVDLDGGSASPGATARITSSTISNNVGHGVEVVRAPSVNGAAKLDLGALMVSDNGAVGVYFHGAADIGDVSAMLWGSVISTNGAAGVLIDSSPTLSFITEEGIMLNDISLNNQNGVHFAGPNALHYFYGNTVHANAGDQILINGRQHSNAIYNFRSPSHTCDVYRNQVYCYAPGSVGIRASGLLAIGYKVDARNMSWRNAAPVFGDDYVVTGANSLDDSLQCPPITTCP